MPKTTFVSGDRVIAYARRDVFVAWLANKVLRLASKDYRATVAGAIALGEPMLRRRKNRTAVVTRLVVDEYLDGFFWRLNWGVDDDLLDGAKPTCYPDMPGWYNDAAKVAWAAGSARASEAVAAIRAGSTHLNIAYLGRSTRDGIPGSVYADAYRAARIPAGEGRA